MHYGNIYADMQYKIMTQVNQCNPSCSQEATANWKEIDWQADLRCDCKIPFNFNFPSSYLATVDVPLLKAMVPKTTFSHDFSNKYVTNFDDES